MSEAPSDQSASPMDRALRLAKQFGGYSSIERARFRCEQVFKGLDLSGKAVLEIGAGAGIFSAYAAASGARRVVALEPEIAGSTEGFQAQIHQVAEKLDLPALEVRGDTIQEYESGQEKFDLVLSYNSVNHFDEPMCVELRRSEKARSVYREIFEKIRDMTTPGGLLVICDCSRRNLLGDLGIRNPVAPTIEWYKHHSPGTWVRMLQPLGFSRRRLSWYLMHPCGSWAGLAPTPSRPTS
jgi:cyclopropane fatty-acyl-phospholipid synthase-like methyltransferase